MANDIPRRRILTWADSDKELTHYAPNGVALLLCLVCLQSDDSEAPIGQAITIARGSAVCEFHLFPGGTVPKTREV